MVSPLGTKLEQAVGDSEVTKGALVDFLAENGVDVSEWGTNKAKTVDDLLEEIRQGESQLIVFEEGLRRVTPIDQIEVRYTDPDGVQYRLVEEKQTFRDGRERVRNLPRSLGEKIKAGEDPQQVASRGVYEELGILIDSTRFQSDDTEYEERESPSYPNLVTRYDKHNFLVELTDEEFNPQGYMEDDGKKVTTFVWQVIEA